MSANVLWLNVSSALQRFSQPLVKLLCTDHQVYEWAYSQSLDEPLSLDVAVDLLHDYLRSVSSQPVHLIGHSTSGVVGLIYARRYPQHVASLTLLSVGVNPSLDWQAHYYAQAQFMCCQRYQLLAQMVHNLFGRQPRSSILGLIRLLEQDLLTSLSPHTLASYRSVSPTAAPVPMLICGGSADVIIDTRLFTGWQPWLDTRADDDLPSDQIWLCPEGGHFFHFDQPELTCQIVSNFWAGIAPRQPKIQSHQYASTY